MNLLSTRSTQRCTISSNSGIFSLSRGRPLEDTRVLSLKEVGEKDLKVFVENSIKITSSNLHRKIHTVFLKAEDVCCTKIDLCNFFVWCKCSVVIDNPGTRINGKDLPEAMYMTFIKTHFGLAILIVQLLCNFDKCEVNVLDGNKTVHIQIKRKNEFKGPLIFGIGLHTPNMCRLCKTPNSDTVKLRLCSRCFTFDRIKHFYCSRKCQLLDFPRHCHVCAYDWFADDWREEAPQLVNE